MIDWSGEEHLMLQCSAESIAIVSLNYIKWDSNGFVIFLSIMYTKKVEHYILLLR